MISPVVEAKLDEIADICRRHGVRRLELFGSATSDRFDPNRSDLDFAVDMQEMSPVEYSRAWLGLLDALEKLFGRHVDLVTRESIRNPHFAASLDETGVLLYAA